MAIKRLTINGFGQVELNNAAFRRDGRIEAQCKPNATDFANIPVENGMILAVDKVNNEVKLPVNGNLPVALVYSAEHAYESRNVGLKDFKLNGTDDFYPREGYLAVGDLFTENCLCYDTTTFSDEATLISALKAYKTTAVYGGQHSSGAVLIQTSAPNVGPKLKVTKCHTMPDGQLGVQFQVIAD